MNPAKSICRDFAEIHNAKHFAGAIVDGWQSPTTFTAQSGRPFSVWNGASFRAGGDYNLDAGGGAVGGGFYDRPDAPAPGTPPTTFSRQDFLMLASNSR